MRRPLGARLFSQGVVCRHTPACGHLSRERRVTRAVACVRERECVCMWEREGGAASAGRRHREANPRVSLHPRPGPPTRGAEDEGASCPHSRSWGWGATCIDQDRSTRRLSLTHPLPGPLPTLPPLRSCALSGSGKPDDWRDREEGSVRPRDGGAASREEAAERRPPGPAGIDWSAAALARKKKDIPTLTFERRAESRTPPPSAGRPCSYHSRSFDGETHHSNTNSLTLSQLALIHTYSHLSTPVHTYPHLSTPTYTHLTHPHSHPRSPHSASASALLLPPSLP